MDMFSALKVFKTLAIVDGAVNKKLKAAAVYNSLKELWGEDLKKFLNSENENQFKEFMKVFASTATEARKKEISELFEGLKKEGQK
jgi:hypothetical protein